MSTPQELRNLAIQIKKYGIHPETGFGGMVLTKEGETDIVEALRFHADALEKSKS